MKAARRKHQGALAWALSLLIVLPVAVEAAAPDLTNMGRLLRFNRSSITFVDNCISNLPQPVDPQARTKFSEEIAKSYKLAIQHDFFARLWYLQGDYSRTYKELKKSQNYLQGTFRRILINYVDETWVLLEESAPLVVRTNDYGARHLLRLGYRDLESARLFFQRGNNIRPTLHTNQIQHYREGIKRIRRARRYAILSLIEAKLPNSEKAKFRVVTLNDYKLRKKGESFRQDDYTRVLNLLVNLMGRRLIPRYVRKPLPRENSLAGKGRLVELRLLEVHQDNYNRLLSARRSLWRKLAGKLSASDFNQQKSLPKRNSKNRYFIPRSDADKKPATGTTPGTKPTGKPPAGTQPTTP